MNNETQHGYLGEIKTYSLDLHACYKELIDARRIIIKPEEADAILTRTISAPARDLKTTVRTAGMLSSKRSWIGVLPNITRSITPWLPNPNILNRSLKEHNSTYTLKSKCPYLAG